MHVQCFRVTHLFNGDLAACCKIKEPTIYITVPVLLWALELNSQIDIVLMCMPLARSCISRYAYGLMQYYVRGVG
eukprot:scaffold163126_cov18-Tisochrysis_lutea.AAC.1